MAKWFDKWFGGKEKPPETSNDVQILHETRTGFTNWNKSAYENDVFRGAVDSIARHAAKLKPIHIIGGQEGDKRLNRILQTRPNPYMNGYDLLYKTVTHYFLHNNAFIYVQKDHIGNINAFYPIQAQSVEFGTDEHNQLLVKFLFADGSDVYLPYSDIIHLRRHFNDNQLLGDTNSALDGLLNVSHKQNEGIVRAIELGASIRGIVKFTGIVNDEALKEKKDVFINEYLNMNNNGGVITTDAKTEYENIDSKPVSIDETQLQSIENKVYNYLGIHRNIISGNFTEDEFNSFYESVIEPLSKQLSLEFTEKCFTEIEQNNENEIHFDSYDLQFRSNESKINYIKNLLPTGVLTINQALEILNLPQLDDELGDRRLQTLNYVDFEQANAYQLGVKKGLDPDKKEGNDSENERNTDQ